MQTSQIASIPSLSSFSSVLIGAVIAAAIALAFASLSLALGLGTVDAYSDNPLAGVGGALGIPSLIGVALALIAGAFVAGRLAGACGFAHGLATWALLVIIGVSAGSLAIGGAARTAGAVAGTVATTAGSAVGGAAQGIGGVISKGMSALDTDVLGDIDWDKTSSDIRQTLRDTDIEGLQPDQLQQSFQAAGQDIKDAARSILINPYNAGDALDSLGTKLKDRLDQKAAEFDREAAINALVNNGMDRPSAEQAVDNAKRLLDDAQNSVRAGLERAERAVAEIRQTSQDLERQSREAADRAAAASSKAAWWAFIAAIVGAVVSAFAGHFGVTSRDRISTAT